MIIKNLNIYRVFCYKITNQINPNTNTSTKILQVGTLKPEFAKYVKTSRSIVTADLFKQLIGKEINLVNTKTNNMHLDISIGNNKHVFLDFIF